MSALPWAALAALTWAAGTALPSLAAEPGAADAQAGASASATVTLASEYVWRGLSLSRRRPALLLGLDFAHPLPRDLSLEGGLWAYSTRYEEVPQVRLDSGAYARLGGPVGWGGLRWGAQVARYVFPQLRDWNYTEHALSLARAAGPETGSLGFEFTGSWARNAFGSGSRGRYLELDTTVRLPRGLDLKLHVGRSVYQFPQRTYPHFTDAKVALATAWQGFDLEAGWVATRGADQGRMGRPRLVASVARSF